MPGTKKFIDTNVFLYLLSSDSFKAGCVERVLKQNPIISVQVLNEITHVGRQKLKMSWNDLNEFLTLICSVCKIHSLSFGAHEKGRQISERYQVSVYDAMILSSALHSGCDILYSEDMHHGLEIEDRLIIHNPFLSAAHPS